MSGRHVLRSTRRRRDLERGALVPVLGAALVVLLAAGALALDMTALVRRGDTLQAAADAAALAAVTAWFDTGDQSSAQAAVSDVMHEHGLAHGDTWFTVVFPSATESQVVITDDSPGIFLAQVVGINDRVVREATAYLSTCAGDAATGVVTRCSSVFD